MSTTSGPTGSTHPGVAPGATPLELALLPHENRGPSVRAGIWALTGLATIFLGIRVYCKLVKSHRLFWDDCVLIASYICLVIDAILSTIAIGIGFGKHQYDIDIGVVNTLATVGLCSVTFAIVGQAWSKTSFAVTLLRISDGWTRLGLIVAIITMNILFGLGALFFWVQCAPLESAWHPLVPGRCWNPNVNVVYGIIVSAYSGILDLVFSILPWKVILTIQMKKKEKVGVALAMSMGIFAAISAFVKCSQIPALLSGDFTYDGANLVLWGVIETAVTIMAASIPVMRVLFRDIASPNRYYVTKESKGSSTSALRSDGSSKMSSVTSRTGNTTTTISSTRTQPPSRTATRPPARPPTRPPLAVKNPNRSWLADQGDSGGSEQSILGRAGPPYGDTSASGEGRSRNRPVPKREKSVTWGDGMSQDGIGLESV